MGRVRTESNRQLERLFRMGTVGGLTDGQLLERFVAGDDEAAESAFEAIVERHGPMVLRVCRTVLRDAHAAEDAFQATFLVLARKAKTLGERDLLSNWLYGVATRTARKAKVAAARRIGRDREAAYLHAAAIGDRPPDEIRDELGRILHEEIGRLPGSYRAAVVTCYLEGMTQEQAARQLRLAESTVRGRLARVRKMLGSRLTRRGVSLLTGLLALGHDAQAASTASRLPESIVRSVARSALLFGKSGKATGGAVSSTARGIASGVLSTMWLPSLKTVAAAMVALTFTAVAMTHRAAEAQPQVQPDSSTATSSEPAIEPTDPLPQDSDSGQLKARTSKGDGRSQSVAVDPELADLAPGSIVRAVPVSKDSMILAYLPDQNVGHVDNLGLANNGGGVRALFDWPAIPPDEAAADDRRFLIAVYSRRTTSRPSAGPIVAHEILADWPEIAHWSEMPRYDRSVAAIYEFEPGDGWKLFDITPLIRARAKAGRKGHGILLRFQGEDHDGASWSGYDLVSREGVGEWMKRRPVLLIVDASKSGQAKRVAEARTKSPNGRKPSDAPAVDSELVKAAPGPIVRTVPVSKDCMVLAYMPGWNFGNVDNIGFQNVDGGNRTLLDWPAIDPAEAASPDRRFLIALYSRKTTSHPPAGPINAFEILGDWPERASWNTQPDYATKPIATYEFEPGDGWKLFDITPLIRTQAKAASKGHGLVFRFLSENASGARNDFSGYQFVSREGAGEWANRRPVLLVVKDPGPEKPSDQ